MSTVTVQNTILDAAGSPIANAVVRISLVASTTAKVPGYLPTADIIGAITVATDATGHWSVSLTPNSQITPAGTYYLVNESGYVSTIVVPVGAGPFNLSALLTPAPTPLPPGFAGIAVAANGVVAGTRPEVNLVAGANVAVTATDNPGAGRVDVVIDSAGGGGGGIPSSTVVSETSYGQAANAGAATTFARGDHTHGSPVLASSAASGSAVGDAAAVGTASTPARADHVHGREAFGAVAAQTAFGAASSNGAAATVARSDHTHGTPAAPTPAGIGAVPATRQVNSGTGLTGGGDLSADRTLAVSYGTTAGTAAQGNDARIVGAAPAASPTLTGTATVNGRIVTTPVTLTDAATIATDASLGNHFRVVLGGNRILGNPSNPGDGQRAIWELIQDAVGNRGLTPDTAFAFGSDITAIALSTGANKRDFLGAVYNATTSKWDVIAFVKGY